MLLDSVYAADWFVIAARSGGAWIDRRDALVLALHGFGSSVPYKEIGESLGWMRRDGPENAHKPLSRERIRQIESKAWLKIFHSDIESKIWPYYYRQLNEVMNGNTR